MALWTKIEKTFRRRRYSTLDKVYCIENSSAGLNLFRVRQISLTQNPLIQSLMYSKTSENGTCIGYNKIIIDCVHAKK